MQSGGGEVNLSGKPKNRDWFSRTGLIAGWRPIFHFDGVGMAAVSSSSRGEFLFSALAGPFQPSADTAIPSYFAG